MSLDHIRQTVLAEARAEGERILATAREHKQQRLDSARESLDAEFVRRREQAEHEQRQQADRQVVARRAEHNLALLKRRNDILDELFNRAAECLADLPDEEYAAVVGEWMQALPDDVGGTVLCNERDQERLAGLVARLNERRPEGARLRMAEYWGPLRGGVLFQTDNYEIDLSLDSRLKRLRETLAPDVARLVFPDEVTV